jgi:hypothetical protein
LNPNLASNHKAKEYEIISFIETNVAVIERGARKKPQDFYVLRFSKKLSAGQVRASTY